MDILLLGSGGREHALAWKLAQSDQCDTLYIAPGNAGTAQEGINVDLSPTDFDAVKAFVLDKDIDMVVVGPEAPLAAGIYDYFAEDADLANLPVIGPSRGAAQLESSKGFAKAFMERHGIPTAAYGTFTPEEMDEAEQFILDRDEPIVLKADGLAAGKGVLICETYAQAKTELQAILGGKFGDAGNAVVIEDFLDGIELSVFVFTDGEHYTILPTAKDYKRIGEYDTGLNTGGMGAISPVPFADNALMQKIESRIIQPTIRGLQREQLTYKGVIYFGLMNVAGDPYVIEYNVRFGDPEAEVLVPKIETDLVTLFSHLDAGTLDQLDVMYTDEATATVMLVSGGYPEGYEKGKVIHHLPKHGDSLFFHAGTREDNGEVVTNGGRVLTITSFGDTLEEALDQSNSWAKKIEFEGKYFRSDIGFDVL